MAIYQRDREFYRLFSEIEVDVFPLKFLDNVICFLNDGRQITLTSEDFKDYPDDTDLETMIRNLEYYQDLANIKINVNYGKIEDDVGSEVSRILKNK